MCSPAERRLLVYPVVQLKAPVAATADQKAKLKKSLRPGTAFGMARQ